MNTVEQIISEFPSMAAMARACGHKNATTVMAWKKKGRIPYWRRAEVESAASQAGVKIEAEVLNAAFS